MHGLVYKLKGLILVKYQMPEFAVELDGLLQEEAYTSNDTRCPSL